MTNLDPNPTETVCATDEHGEIEVVEPRDVPLGGPRAMRVRRTLPVRSRTLIGSWCFVDHYGPDDVSESGGMRVARHPHTGLATVSWIFSGEIDHLDSAGNSAMVRPGELNLMIAGDGITHHEFSTPATSILHGFQLWYAMPDSTRRRPPSFSHYVPDPVEGDGFVARVFIGDLLGASAPVETFTPPLIGAELRMEPGTRLVVDVDAAHEHGIVVDSGGVTVEGEQVIAGQLAHVPVGRETVELVAGDSPALIMFLGGEPLGEEIVMWWNFIGRSHEEIVAARARYQEEISGEFEGEERFGPYPDGLPDPLPAPTLPNARLRTRK